MSVCTALCPISLTAGIIERKWTTLILRELFPGKKRYHEIKKMLPGISSKILAERLDFLEDQKLIFRRLYITVPLTTDYELTELGYSFGDVLQAMASFGQKLNENATYAVNA